MATNKIPVSNRKVENVKREIEIVNNFIGSKHDITPFIYFEVNNFKLDTRSAESRNHYAISLENQKTGVGAGNKFTLTIAYNRDFSNFESANDLEYALALIDEDDEALIYNVDTEISEKRKRNDCFLQYGYLDETSVEPTSIYSGKLLEYNVNVNKQIITYTLKGYTSEQAKIGNVNWYPEIESSSSQKGNNGIDKILVADKFLTREEIEEKIKNEDIENIVNDLDESYIGPIYCNPIKALIAFIHDYNYGLKDTKATRFEVDCTAFGGGVGDTQKIVTTKCTQINELEPVIIALCRNQTPLDYVKYLISMCSKKVKGYALKYTKEQKQILDRWIYTIQNNSEDNKIRIKLDVISSEKARKAEEYEFKGYDVNNNLLINYSLDYNGSVALAVSEMFEEKETNNIYIDSYGAVRESSTITKDMFTEGAISKINVQLNNTWLDKISTANKCTLVTYGLPFEIPVSTIFRVSFYLGNADGNSKYHHTSGRCMVVGITDKIENSLFTTTFQMIRMPGRGEEVTSKGLNGRGTGTKKRAGTGKKVLTKN